MDSTVVMDWSKDTSVVTADEDVGGESGSGFEDMMPAATTDATDDAGVNLEDVSLQEGLDIDLSGFDDLGMDEQDASVQDGEPSSTAEEDQGSELGFEDELSSVSFNLDDLDVDLDATASSDDLDDFTSTIQSTLIDLGVEESELDVALEPVEDDAVPLGEPDEHDEAAEDLALENLLSDLDTFSGDKDRK